MVTFNRVDKFGADKGYTRLRFGEKSKVLETELNEFQKIVQTQVETMGRNLYTNGFMTKSALVYAAGVLTVPADTIVVDGAFVKYQDAMTIAAPAGTTVFLAEWEQEISYTDTIRRDGNLSGGAAIADNGIFDYDLNMETSRRVQRRIQLVTSTADGTRTYLPIASIGAANAVTDNRLKCQVLLANLSFQSADVISALGFTPATNARLISAGAGLTGGGSLAADRTLSVSFAGTGVAATAARSDHNHDTTYVPMVRSINAGDGLTGGGALSDNRTLSVSFAGSGSASTAARSDHNHDGTYVKPNAGDFTGYVSVSAPTPNFFATRNVASQNDGRYGGLVARDKSSWKAAIYWDYILSKWVLSTDGTYSYQDIIHSGGGQAIGGTLAVSGAITEEGTALSAKYVPASRLIGAGTGLTGGGSLGADRTLAVSFAGTGVAGTAARSDHNHDTTYAALGHNHDSAYAPRTRVVSTGAGLTGGGDLTTDRTLAVSFAGTGAASTAARSDHHHNTTYVPLGRALTAGVGLIGGGDLADNRSLAVNFMGTGSAGSASRSDHHHDTVYAKQTSSNLVYYVRTDGNDSNSGLVNNSSGAFRSIGRAIAMTPQIVNHTVTINVDAGTYNEDLSIEGLSGKGVLYFNPSVNAPSANYNIQSLNIINCAVKVAVYGMNAKSTTTHGFAAGQSASVELMYCSVTAPTTSYHGLSAYTSNVYAYSCNFSNRNCAIYAGQNSRVLAWGNGGSGNTVSLYAGEGGTISEVGSVPNATYRYNTANGGGISANVINPWGDNTTTSRSFAGGVPSGPQTVPSATLTRVVAPYTAKYVDNLSEFTPLFARFTAKSSGAYLVSAALTYNAPGLNSGVESLLFIYKNGAFSHTIASSRQGSFGTITLTGSAVVMLNPGEYVEIFTMHYQGSTANISTSEGNTYVSIIRIA